MMPCAYTDRRREIWRQQKRWKPVFKWPRALCHRLPSTNADLARDVRLRAPRSESAIWKQPLKPTSNDRFRDGGCIAAKLRATSVKQCGVSKGGKTNGSKVRIL